jgi:hypothetical protein
VGDDGWYLVSVKLGDAGFARDQMQVRNADTGQVLVASTSTAAGQFAERNFVVKAIAGALRLEFRDVGGDPYWTANAIEIRPAVILDIGAPSPGPLTADNTTVDTFTIFEGTPGALAVGDLITVATTLGTVVSADQDPNLAGIQVRVTTAGQVNYQIRRPSGAGTALVSLSEVTGEHTGCVAIDYVAPSSRLFDFNTTTSPTQLPSSPPTVGGYIGVLPTDVYSSQRGYGWDVPLISTGSIQAGGYDRGDFAGTQVQEELRRDGHFANRSSGPRTFSVDLPAAMDTYLVNVTIGDTYARDAIQLKAEGVVRAVVNTAAGQWSAINFEVTVSDGRLDLEIADLSGDVYWVINGLEIRPLSQIAPLALTGPTGPLDADGLTADPFSVTAPSGSLVTLATDKGTISGVADASATYAGLQVLGTGAAINFTVIRPASSGAATVTATEVTGASRGTHTVTYQLPATRKFDFNGSSNDTAAGFIGVRGSDVGSVATRGYGWLSPVQEFQRASATATPVALYRDGAWAADRGARTFQVAAVPNATYMIRAHVGDSFARDLIQFETENGGGTVTALAPNTAANQFTFVDFVAVNNGDNVLTITVRDLGGDPYWALNGLEVTIANPLAIDAPAQPTHGSFASPVVGLTADALAPITTAAIDRWRATGLSPTQSAALAAVTFRVADLSAYGYLGLAAANSIILDNNAAGYGWSLDTTRGPAAGQVDLLSAVMHELGHVLGYQHSDDVHDVMFSSLSPALRPNVLNQFSTLAPKASDFLTPSLFLSPNNSRVSSSQPSTTRDQLFTRLGETDALLTDRLTPRVDALDQPFGEADRTTDRRVSRAKRHHDDLFAAWDSNQAKIGDDVWR